MSHDRGIIGEVKHNNQLRLMIEKGQEDGVRDILEAAETDPKRDGGLLRTAIIFDQLNIAKQLLEKKADPNAWLALKPPNHSLSPLLLAARFDRLDIIAPLLQAGAEVIAADDKKCTETELELLMSHVPFEMAIAGSTLIETDPVKIEERLLAVHLLLKHGATFNHPLDLYIFLHDCDSQSPQLLDAMTKFCEELNRKARTMPGFFFHRHQEALNYLEELNKKTDESLSSKSLLSSFCRIL